MNPRVMLRELRRQERHTQSYVHSLRKQAELAMKRFNSVPTELSTAISAATANLREIRKDIREWRAKCTPVREEE